VAAVEMALTAGVSTVADAEVVPASPEFSTAAGVSMVADAEIVPASWEFLLAGVEVAVTAEIFLMIAEVGEPELSSGQVDLMVTTSCT